MPWATCSKNFSEKFGDGYPITCGMPLGVIWIVNHIINMTVMGYIHTPLTESHTSFAVAIANVLDENCKWTF